MLLALGAVLASLFSRAAFSLAPVPLIVQNLWILAAAVTIGADEATPPRRLSRSPSARWE
ncbi:MAG TPA: hypothetical protein VJ140_02010 [Actinomycetota bacterium]|nr:hypothetical protein [Actinomycetota bacterium]